TSGSSVVGGGAVAPTTIATVTLAALGETPRCGIPRAAMPGGSFGTPTRPREEPKPMDVLFVDLTQYIWIVWLVFILIAVIIELITLEFTFLMIAAGSLGGL